MLVSVLLVLLLTVTEGVGLRTDEDDAGGNEDGDEVGMEFTGGSEMGFTGGSEARVDGKGAADEKITGFETDVAPAGGTEMTVGVTTGATEETGRRTPVTVIVI